jgi:hypothetical protein
MVPKCERKCWRDPNATLEKPMSEPILTAIFDTADQERIHAAAQVTGWSAESLAAYLWELGNGTPEEIAREELRRG